MNYGIPYMGSKSKIIKDLIKIFPKAENFYDLFGGGFSVTHGMLLHRRNDFKEFHFNEIRPGICELIQDAIKGKYSYKNFRMPWVSREEFEHKKELDPFIKILWSFGNNGIGYLFGSDIEPYKRSMHYAVVFNQFDEKAKSVFGMDRFHNDLSITERRLFLSQRVRFLNPRKKDREIRNLQQLQNLQQLERLQRLEALQQLEALERLQQLNFYNQSYEHINIKPNSIIYCDIPYKGTADYGSQFNHYKFFDWANSQDNPVFISEYNVEDNRFRCIWNEPKTSLISRTNTTGNKIEKVYVNRSGYDLILKNLRGKGG